MGQVTVFSGPERRRRWSEEERLRWYDATYYGYLELLEYPKPTIAAVVRGAREAGLEPIVVDDGSSDATWSIIDGAAAADPRVRGVRQCKRRRRRHGRVHRRLVMPDRLPISCCRHVRSVHCSPGPR